MTKKNKKPEVENAHNDELAEAVIKKLTGKLPRLTAVPVSNLKIDLAYQRGPDEREIQDIINNFDLSSYRTLDIGQRDNGDMMVVDGGQRLRAAIRVGYKGALQCRVFPSPGTRKQAQQLEAQAYDSINKRIAPHTAAQTFRSRVVAGREPYASMAPWLKKHGFCVPGFKKELDVQEDEIDFVATLVRYWDKDPEASKRALLAQRALIRGEGLHGCIHKGLVHLICHGVEADKQVDRITAKGVDRRVLVTEIRNIHGRATAKASALAILDKINHGLHNKLVMTEARVHVEPCPD